MSTLVGNYPIFEGTSLYSLRLDHRISTNNQLMLRAGVSPSTTTGIQVNAQGPQNFGQNAYSRTSQQTYRDFSINAHDTLTLGNNKVNDFCSPTRGAACSTISPARLGAATWR